MDSPIPEVPRQPETAGPKRTPAPRLGVPASEFKLWRPVDDDLLKAEFLAAVERFEGDEDRQPELVDRLGIDGAAWRLFGCLGLEHVKLDPKIWFATPDEACEEVALAIPCWRGVPPTLGGREELIDVIYLDPESDGSRVWVRTGRAEWINAWLLRGAQRKGLKIPFATSVAEVLRHPRSVLRLDREHLGDIAGQPQSGA